MDLELSSSTLIESFERFKDQPSIPPVLNEGEIQYHFDPEVNPEVNNCISFDFVDNRLILAITTKQQLFGYLEIFLTDTDWFSLFCMVIIEY